MDGRRKAVILTKADAAAMTSLWFLSPRGHESSHTKSEDVKVTRAKHHLYPTFLVTNVELQ